MSDDKPIQIVLIATLFVLACGTLVWDAMSHKRGMATWDAVYAAFVLLLFISGCSKERAK